MSERDKYADRDAMWAAGERSRREAGDYVASQPVWNEEWLKKRLARRVAERAEVRKDWQESKRIAELLIRRRSPSRPL